MPGIDRYLGVRAATNPVYSKSTGQWYFLMNLTNTFQVYGLARAGAWPAMLTDYPERVSGIHAAPEGPILVLTRDTGGNEHHQFYCLNLDTMAVATLTDASDAVHLFGCFSPDGQSIAYTSTARNGRDYDVYTLPLTPPFQSTMVLSRTGHWHARDWSPQGELLLEEMNSSAQQSLYRFNLQTKALNQLTPEHQAAVYHAPALAPDGSLFVLTDYDHDFVGLARIPRPGALDFLVSEAADLDLLTLDRSGHQLAYTVNRQGFSELHLHDLRTGDQSHVPTFDHDVIFDLEYDSDGQSLAVTHSAPDRNMNISLISLASGKVESLTLAPMTGLNPKSLITPALIHYPSFDGLQIPAYLYRPLVSGTPPVVISIHGGPESQERPSFSGWYQYLLAQGYALLTPNVRGSTGYGKTYAHLDDRERRMDSVSDIASLVDWIRMQPDLDSRRIGVYGGSYGGFMVLSAITQYPDLFQAAIDIVGIANLESFLENTSEWRRALREVEYGSLATDRKFLRQFSPIHLVDRIQTPLFVVHGANDPRVPLNEAEQIVDALQRRSRPVEFRVFSDEGHGIAKLTNRLALYPEMVAFLDRYLKPTGKTGDEEGVPRTR